MTETNALRVEEEYDIPMRYPISNSGASPAEMRRPGTASFRQEAKGAILAEQLSYLIGHTETCQARRCPECARLQIVEEVLLRPFRVKIYATLPPAA